MIYDEETRKRTERVHRAELAHAQRAYDLAGQFLRDAYDGVEPSEKRLAWLFVARGRAALRSSVNLFCLGDETDSIAVCRTLIELGIDFEFIWLDDTKSRVQRFYDFGVVSDEKLDNALKKIYGNDAIEDDRRRRLEPLVLRDPRHEHASYDDLRRKIQADRDRLRPDFGNRWAKQQIAQRAEAVGVKESTYDLLYAIGCDASHSSIGTMTNFIRPSDSEPSSPSHPMALTMATRAFGLILQKASKIVGVPVPGLDELARDLHVALYAGVPKASAPPP